MESYNSCSAKKSRLAMALTAALLLSGAGCAKQDVNPPAIQIQSEIPEWIVEGEDIILNVNASDDKGVTEVYIQFNDGSKSPLAEIEGETSAWETSFKLPPGNHSFSVVARDKSNEAKVDKELIVYPQDADSDGIGYRDELKYELDPNKPNPVTKYALDKNLGIYLPQLLSLENDGVVDENDKAFVDLVAKYPKAGELVPGIYAQLLLLPDLSLEKYSKIDKNDLVATEKILQLTSDPSYKEAFLQMEDAGVPDKRKYCTPLECLLWEAYDNNQLDNLLKNYSLEKLMENAWKNTNTSNKYRSDRWKNFDEVVARLNSPELVTRYMLDNISYDMDALATPKRPLTPQQLFSDNKKEAGCMDQSWFACKLLNENGYSDDIDDILSYGGNNKSDGTCILGASSGYSGHAACLYIQNGKLYIIDVGRPTSGSGNRGIKGPFGTIESAADTTFPGWSFYMLNNAKYGDTYLKRK